MTLRALPVLMSLLLAAQVSLAAQAAAQPDVNFKIYSLAEPAAAEQPSAAGGETGSPAPAGTGTAAGAPAAAPAATEAAAGATPEGQAASPPPESAAAGPAESQGAAAAGGEAAVAGDATRVANKVLQGYIRVVPSGTKIPIIMDTAVDSDTSQEGDEFSARTAEDLTIDGGIVVPAGSVIKGRIAQINAPRRLERNGSVALKFDTVTTPDNRQIPIVANIVARGGVVHARRGMKDVAIDTGMVALPTAAGLGIGLLAGGIGKSSSSSSSSTSSSSKGIGRPAGAVIGAGVGLAVGVIILLAKKGKRVDIRPGDELKIELAEDLRMPM